MDNFRIIAILTGENGNSPRNFRKTSDSSVEINYLKNLKPNTVYSFYGHYSFPNNDFSLVKYEPNNDIELYTIKLSNNRSIPININAIVGENGSGKSTLIELIYWMNYNLGCKFNLLETDEGEKYLINDELDLQLLYSINIDIFYIIKFKGGQIEQCKFKLINDTLIADSKPHCPPISSIRDLKDFFYSIVVNYSQYALNALEMGEWINPLFHKNDGYQTPIVLSPMRLNGNIDINKERKLLSRRLQANVLEKVIGNDADSLRNLANNKIAKVLSVSYDTQYFEELEKKVGIIDSNSFKETKDGIISNFKLDINNNDTNYATFVELIIKYVYYKLKKIVFTYPVYSSYRDQKSIKNIKNLLSVIKTSNSHIVFKVKGAILHLKYFSSIYGKSKFNFDFPFIIEIAYFSKVIENEIKKKEKFLINTFMMAMPSFFNVDIIPEIDLPLSSFSSGEKQRIYSLSSIIYHLINLNSVEEQKLLSGEKFANYSYINIVLDEIELYYHPEWQRRYVADLLDYISKINPVNLANIKGINIMFITHSPYILSDITKFNILKLKEGTQQLTLSSGETFGANIHDLLKNSFFLEGGSMGELAKDKINQTIFFLNFKILENELSKIKTVDRDNELYSLKEEELNELKKRVLDFNLLKHKILIQNIGEPLLKSKLSEMYDQVTREKTEIEIIEKKIFDLQIELEKKKKLKL